MSRRTRRLLGIAVAWLCVAICTPAWAGEPGDLDGGAPAAAEEGCVRIEPSGGSADGPVGLDVKFIEEQASAAMTAFDCTVSCDEGIGHAVLELVVKDGSGMPVFEGTVSLMLPAGRSACRFEWEPQGLADGIYFARFELWRPPLRRLAWKDLTVCKSTPPRLAARVDRVEQELESLAQGMQSDELGKGALPYVRARLALAADYVGPARKAIAQKDWRRAHAFTDYLERAAAGVRAGLAFTPCFAPELAEPIPGLDPAGVGVGEGGFCSAGRPVFLAGATGDAKLVAQFSRLRRYGFNAAGVRVAPDGTAEGDAKAGGAIQRAADKAGRERLALTAFVPLSTLPGWARAKWPALEQGTPFDVSHAAVPDVMARCLKPVLSNAADQPMLMGLCVAEEPVFRLDGTTFHDGFVSFLRKNYEDYTALNREWRSRHKGFEDVQVQWDTPRTAYQYDLQTYQQGIVTEFFRRAVSVARNKAPGLLIQAAVRNAAFEPGESASGVEREALAG
ncbi:MAG: hypothetical protein JXR94_20940, partial [Candidatus Hydrogenedentes bacterium]|nr:hypothetical protein [Candidatus Hydrogenedentota bacterium]